MSKKTDLRARNLARAAYKLKLAGYTTREIATALGLTPEVVKARVAMGERLSQECAS